MRQKARNDRNKRGCMNLVTINDRFSGLVCLHIRRKGGGAFISQRQRWSGVFAPVRTNEKKTIHSFLWYPLCVWSTMQANYVGELCRANCLDEPHLNYV